MRSVDSRRAFLAALGLGALVTTVVTGMPWTPVKWGREFAPGGPVLALEHALGIVVMYFVGVGALVVAILTAAWVRRDL